MWATERVFQSRTRGLIPKEPIISGLHSPRTSWAWRDHPSRNQRNDGAEGKQVTANSTLEWEGQIGPSNGEELKWSVKIIWLEEEEVWGNSRQVERWESCPRRLSRVSAQLKTCHSFHFVCGMEHRFSAWRIPDLSLPLYLLAFPPSALWWILLLHLGSSLLYGAISCLHDPASVSSACPSPWWSLSRPSKLFPDLLHPFPRSYKTTAKSSRKGGT